MLPPERRNNRFQDRFQVVRNRCFRNLPGSPLEPYLFNNLTSCVAQFPLSALSQRLLVEEKFRHVRGNFSLLTPFTLLHKEYEEVGIWQLYQGFTATILHLFVRDGCRLLFNGLAQPAIEYVSLILKRIGGLFGNEAFLTDGNDPHGEDDAVAGATKEEVKELSIKQNKKPVVQLSKLVLKYAAELCTYPMMVVGNRAIFAHGIPLSEFFSGQITLMQKYGPAIFFDGIVLHAVTNALEEMSSFVIEWALGTYLTEPKWDKADRMFARMGLIALFGQVVNPFAQVSVLRRGETSNFFAENWGKIMSSTEGIPLPPRSSFTTLFQRLCLRTLCYQLALSTSILAFNFWINNLIKDSRDDDEDDEDLFR